MMNFDQIQEKERFQMLLQNLRQEGLEPLQKSKSKNDQDFISRCLRNHFIFYNLSERELLRVRNSMFWIEINERENVFQQGMNGTCFFIIVSGVVQVLIDNEFVRSLKTAEGFGELALLHQMNRPSTVKVKEAATFWAIDRASFKTAVQEIVIEQFQEIQRFLQPLPFYQFLPNQQKQKVASSFVTLKYFKGQNVVQEGDPGSAFYILKEGSAALIHSNIEERKIDKGQSFGINSLYYNTMRKMTVRAEEDVIFKVLGRQTLSQIIGTARYKQIMFQNLIKHTLQTNKYLFEILKNNESDFFFGLKIRYCKINEIIYKKGTNAQKFVIVVEGVIKKTKSCLAIAEAGKYWGQHFIQNKENRLDDDIFAATECVIIQIPLQNLRKFERKIISKAKNNKKQHPMLAIEQLKYVLQLQKNQLGGIYLLKHMDKNIAGKLFFISNLKKKNLYEILINSIEAESQISHPFLIQTLAPIIKEQFILKLSIFIEGQSFYDTMRQIGLFSSKDCQFYISCLLLLLNYLQESNIVLRDLKPDNLLVSENGYLFLISTNGAKSIEETNRTSTVLGTPHYMAPEIILGKEYGSLVDLWSLGVIFYECMVGDLPFGSQTDDPTQIYTLVTQADLHFPKHFNDRRAKKIIQTLLNTKPQHRHGGSISNLLKNVWFENINFNQLLRFKVQPPYEPKIVRKSNAQPISTFQEFLNSIK